ncbi:MAG: sodium:calcium antiporter [Firmicutes bacterium]|nr:sodium:calcium antiporter [Bacillota bacterium]
MEVFIAVVLFLVGFALTVKGADIFVDACKWISRVTGMPKAVVGATIIALATNIPELFVSVFAVYNGSVDMAVANSLGACIVGLGVAFAIIAITSYGITSRENSANFRYIIMLIVTVLLFGFAISGVISIITAIVMVIIAVIFTYASVRTSEVARYEKEKIIGKQVVRYMTMFIIGLALIIIGSFLIVETAEFFAMQLGVSTIVIGLTIMAICSAVPEIVVCCVAIYKKEPEMGVGNLIGTHIFNVAIGMALIVFLSGKFVLNSTMVLFDLPIFLIMAIIVAVPILLKKRIYRWQGYALLTLYIIYFILIFVVY